MAELKPCPFCGGTASVVKNSNTWYRVVCDDCPCEVGRYWFHKRKDAVKAWNRRTTIETNFYDKEETYPNCTVQVLTNTASGETSVGWWENGGAVDESNS